jgi:hypothetical protein
LSPPLLGLSGGLSSSSRLSGGISTRNSLPQPKQAANPLSGSGSNSIPQNGQIGSVRVATTTQAANPLWSVGLTSGSLAGGLPSGSGRVEIEFIRINSNSALVAGRSDGREIVVWVFRVGLRAGSRSPACGRNNKAPVGYYAEKIGGRAFPQTMSSSSGSRGCQP